MSHNKYKERYVRAKLRWEWAGRIAAAAFILSMVALFVFSFGFVGSLGLKNPELYAVLGIVLSISVLGLAGLRKSRLERIIEGRYVNKTEG